MMCYYLNVQFQDQKVKQSAAPIPRSFKSRHEIFLFYTLSKTSAWVHPGFYPMRSLLFFPFFPRVSRQGCAADYSPPSSAVFNKKVEVNFTLEQATKAQRGS